MKTSSSKVVKITQKTSSASLSRAQKLFNKLIKKIEVQRQQLRAWQTAIPLYQQKHAGEFAPLLETYDQHRAQLVALFDRAYHDKIFSKTDREKLADIISHIASELLAQKDDLELKSLFNKYNENDFDTQSDEVKADVKAMMGEMFGIEIEGDIDLNDPEAMLRMMAEKAQKEHEAQEAIQQTQASKRKKSAKQLAKEAKLEEEEKNISQSIREVFRKLASALHPDREQDATEHKRKTDLMQRVNVAYGNKDLLQLLELQLEVEQIDQSMINTISEDRLKHYNQILTEQSSELEFEVAQNELAFRLRFQFAPDSILAPAFLILDLDREISQLQQDINGIKQDLENFEQAKKIKTWLKTYQLSPQSPYGNDPFDDFVLNAFKK
ncbi:MAG: molecular chaperone DnaJ [Burkholderiaceae bacterium]